MAEQTTTHPMTLADYRALPESTRPLELIYGALIMSPTPIFQHQIVSGNIYAFIRAQMPSGQVVSAPMDVYLGENVLQPDVFWLAPDSKCVLGADNYLYGPPELVVEILSPSTEKRDRREKFDIYAAAGVGEYWLVSPEAAFIEVYVGAAGAFERKGVFVEGDTFASAALGTDLTLTNIFPQPPQPEEGQADQ